MLETLQGRLEVNQEASGVWLVTYKKASGKPRLEYSESVEEALCFGWVDSLPRKLDEERSMLYFAPRKSGNGWSALNKQRVESLIQSGLMMPAGLAKIEAAKKDGTWSKLDEVEALTVPEDLRKELRKYDHATKFFEAFPKSVKRGILEWILNAKGQRRDKSASLRLHAWRATMNEQISGNASRRYESSSDSRTHLPI